MVPSITLLSSSSNSYPDIWSVYTSSSGKFGDTYIDLQYAVSQRTYFLPTRKRTFYYKPTNAATTINNNGYIKVTFDGEEYYIVDKTYSSSEMDTRATAAPCRLNSSPQRGSRHTLTSRSVYPAADYVYVWISQGGWNHWTAQISNRLPFAITVQYTSTKVTGQSISGVTISSVTIAGGTYDNPSQKNVTIIDQIGLSDKYAGFSVTRWYPTTTGFGSDYLSRQYKWFYVTDGGVAEILTT